ncbi:MAG: hypothetical protein QOK29_2909 [Rhodospirillaceae bacterium]|nr:hypothetical protein [Rhodospirillaceae bacterium]
MSNLRYINVAIPRRYYHAGMEDDQHVIQVARVMVRSFGARAETIMEKRAEDHMRAGEAEGAAFWRRVAQAIRTLEPSNSSGSS